MKLAWFKPWGWIYRPMMRFLLVRGHSSMFITDQYPKG